MNTMTLSFSRSKDAAHITIALQTISLLLFLKVGLGICVSKSPKRDCYSDLITVMPNQTGLHLFQQCT